MDPLTDSPDLERIREELQRARRDETRARVATLAKRPDLGSAQGFGKRIGDGTVEAVSRLTEIGVGESLEATLARAERAWRSSTRVTTGSATGAVLRSSPPG